MPIIDKFCILCGDRQTVRINSPGPHLSRAFTVGEIVCRACVQARGFDVDIDPLGQRRFIALNGDRFVEFGGVFLGRVALKGIA